MTTTLRLQSCLKRLKLPTVARHAEALAREAEESRQGYLEYLCLLLETEVCQREENQQKARIQQARFPLIKTLDTFDFSAMPSLSKPKILTLAQGEFIDKKENVILIGNSGTGKTHLATAIAHAACRQRKRVRFVHAATLVDELLAAQAEHRLTKVEKQWRQHDLIVIDELGYIPFSKTGAELLFQFCSAFYERASLLVTSNLEFAEWTQIFGNDKLTAAFLDRLTHHAHILLMNGESYRFRQSMKRLESLPNA
ncbi:ATP-binding protein [Heliobacterium gestii]|uniref:ATP-binding protein n=1 Tax=Heliomicrobium gestii TaxID=2699 RepID=A0A845LGD2_HELGE|nr:IS21-like element helper ATPase IstB [Heliomicrobium gestii]MBM7867090.1 DNA replication protein DnaC [Heliomicrobium gestii]MZP43495.1 ATP-binding protein [Heliomicrobium gestii]